MSARGFFVAGTDTEVGKTFVSCALLHALRGAGHRATGMKPVASGCLQTPEGLRNEDARALIEASDPRPEYADCNPFAFVEVVSPHIAARQMQVEVVMGPIEAAHARLASHADVVVVEGVGGWQAPLSTRLLARDLPQTLKLPVVLVVGLKLGCLNHAQLSARAIVGDGCRLVGWIGNRIAPEMLRAEENIATLRRLLPVPCLGVVEHGASPAAAAEQVKPALDVLA